MKVLAIIPARGGSKGVPHKNKKILGNKPLIAYTIEAAKQSKYLTDIIVSTDDDDIIQIAIDYGVQAPFKRPAHLANDTAKSIDVVLHAIRHVKTQGDDYDAICLLQPTNPFRTPENIDAAILKFKESTCDGLVSVLEVPHEYNPHWVFKPDAEGVLQIATGDETIVSRRQELPVAYHRDGAIYMTKTRVILEQKSFYGERLGYIRSNPDLHVNIDTLEDWEQAEQMVKKLGM